MPASHALRLERRGPGITVETPAKVNFFLEVVGLREDGYHNLDSIFAAVDWTDRITFDPEEGTIRCRLNRPSVPEGPGNLVFRAAEALRTECGSPRLGASIFLEKNLPAGAGLGGGSSDAAATLHALNQLWELHVPVARLAGIGARLGADIPFFLQARWARVGGIGEQVEPRAGWPGLSLVLYIPPFSLATKDVYAALPAEPYQMRTSELTLRAIAERDIEALGRSFFNRLEEGALALEPRVRIVGEELRAIPSLGCVMTGSGAGWVVLSASPSEAEATARRIQSRLPGVVRVVRAM